MEEARLTTRTLAEAKVEDINKAEEDSKEEDPTTKVEALTTMEGEDSKEEDSTTKVVGLEEAEATSTRMINTSNNHLVLLLVTAAPLQLAKQDSSPTGIVIILKTHTRTKIRIRIPNNIIQTKDGTDN